MTEDSLAILKQRLRTFAAERDWERFHSPKNLAMALIVEAAELVEYFQWLTEQQSANVPAEKLEAIEMELADVFIYLVRLADELDIDLHSAADKKIQVNEQKYPRSKAKATDSARKYTQY